MKHLMLLSAAFLLVAGLAAGQRPVGQFDRVLSVTGTADVDAMTTSGGIVITGVPAGSSARTVHVHAVLEASNWSNSRDVEARIREIERNPPIQQNGNSLRIGYVSNFRMLEGISMRLEIEVPQDTRLRAKSSSGGIRIARIDGAVTVHASSGGIDLVDAGGSVEAGTSSGHIHIARVKGDVTARASSGGIEVAEAGSSLDVRASSGSIHLTQVRAAAIHADTASGGVTAGLAPGAGYDLTVATASGRITTPVMTLLSGFSRHHAGGKVRGGGAQVAIRTASGSVRIE